MTTPLKQRHAAGPNRYHACNYIRIYRFGRAPASYGPPPVILKEEGRTQPGGVRHGEVVVLTRALTEGDWDMVRAFVRGTSRESLRLRFGQVADFTDDPTLKRFFDIKRPNGEMMWMLEEGGAICAIVHLARLSPGQAEIALIVRSDRARRGIGEALLRVAVARAARQGLRTLSAVVLHENTAHAAARAQGRLRTVQVFRIGGRAGIRSSPGFPVWRRRCRGFLAADPSRACRVKLCAAIGRSHNNGSH